MVRSTIPILDANGSKHLKPKKDIDSDPDSDSDRGDQITVAKSAPPAVLSLRKKSVKGIPMPDLAGMYTSDNRRNPLQSVSGD